MEKYGYTYKKETKMKPIELTASEFFSSIYGTDVYSRMDKLKEEVDELDEAINDYRYATDPEDREKKRMHVVEELSDVQAVLTHLSCLFSMSHEQLLLDAIIKSNVRIYVPNFKRDEKVSGRKCNRGPFRII